MSGERIVITALVVLACAVAGAVLIIVTVEALVRRVRARGGIVEPTLLGGARREWKPCDGYPAGAVPLVGIDADEMAE